VVQRLLPVDRLGHDLDVRRREHGPDQHADVFLVVGDQDSDGLVAHDDAGPLSHDGPNNRTVVLYPWGNDVGYLTV
jgi:hypothetical protein